MKRFLLILLTGFLIGTVNFSFCQEEDVPLPKSLQKYDRKGGKKKLNLMAGGSFGVQFGSYTAVSVSPIFGFYPAKWVILGVGGTYMFSYSKPLEHNSHVFGASLFAEGLIWEQRIIAHVGYEYNNYEKAFYDPLTLQITEKKRIDDHAILLGPGYRQLISENINLYILCLFNIMQNKDSFYGNPVFRIGITVDF